ncbi:hypothetical protein CLOM_g7617 [Closterium sp. NIES-68]|nr:hypothetical protein CLOM_g7617 [Closterium sp. NIES-68]
MSRKKIDRFFGRAAPKILPERLAFTRAFCVEATSAASGLVLAKVDPVKQQVEAARDSLQALQQARRALTRTHKVVSVKQKVEAARGTLQVQQVWCS